MANSQAALIVDSTSLSLEQIHCGCGVLLFVGSAEYGNTLQLVSFPKVAVGFYVQTAFPREKAGRNETTAFLIATEVHTP